MPQRSVGSRPRNSPLKPLSTVCHRKLKFSTSFHGPVLIAFAGRDHTEKRSGTITSSVGHIT